MLLSEIGKALMNDPEWQRSVLERGRAGLLDAEVEALLIEAADGRVPVTHTDVNPVDVQVRPSALRLVKETTVEDEVRESVRVALRKGLKEHGLGPEVVEVVLARMDAEPFTDPPAFYEAMQRVITETLRPLADALCESIRTELS